jgi:hypothetical protein
MKVHHLPHPSLSVVYPKRLKPHSWRQDTRTSKLSLLVRQSPAGIQSLRDLINGRLTLCLLVGKSPASIQRLRDLVDSSLTLGLLVGKTPAGIKSLGDLVDGSLTLGLLVGKTPAGIKSLGDLVDSSLALGLLVGKTPAGIQSFRNLVDSSPSDCFVPSVSCSKIKCQALSVSFEGEGDDLRAGVGAATARAPKRAMRIVVFILALERLRTVVIDGEDDLEVWIEWRDLNQG